MLVKYRQHLNTLRDCIDKNQEVISEMLGEHPLSHTAMVSSRKLDEHAAKVRHIDMEHVRTILLFFRLWLLKTVHFYFFVVWGNLSSMVSFPAMIFVRIMKNISMFFKGSDHFESYRT